jgi:23S rRNA pseudouridine1911/1915/1917 synthase
MQRWVITAEESGQTLAAVVRARGKLSWSAAKRLIQQGRVLLAGQVCRAIDRRTRTGQRVEINEQSHPKTGKPAVLSVGSGAGIVIRHADADVVVVEKPAGLTTMRHAHEAAEFGDRARRFLPKTLADLLPDLLARSLPGKPGHVIAVHRLDRDTSGLVVFARTPEAAKHLGRQFREHTVERCYLALVRGQAKPGRIESHLVRDRGDGRRGSSLTGEGERAVTHLRMLEALGEFTLVECRLETGRTHQVRIHLAEQGTPLCGERVYDRDRAGRMVPDESGAPRLALHAASLGFTHPKTGRRLAWESPLPADLKALVRRLEKGGRRSAGE